MNKWLRKSFVVMVSLLTFGIVTPSQFINEVNAEKANDRETFESASVRGSFEGHKHLFSNPVFDESKFVEDLVRQAEYQSYQKFGTRIKPVIENEFRTIIMPNIELALEETASQYPNEDLLNLIITESPSGGLSEKIFHIKNKVTDQDVVRFHVRRDNPPQAGYWFNFHYHTYHDNFQKHHDLGTIFWAKNTPPKWMS
ncbi:MAG: YpjP family protein [Neobacillus sp.]